MLKLANSVVIRHHRIVGLIPQIEYTGVPIDDLEHMGLATSMQKRVNRRR